VASHAYCATLRTGVLTACGLLLAWLGARRNNWELGHLAYPMMALGAYRLLAEDMHQETQGRVVPIAAGLRRGAHRVAAPQSLTGREDGLTAQPLTTGKLAAPHAAMPPAQ